MSTNIIFIIFQSSLWKALWIEETIFKFGLLNYSILPNCLVTWIDLDSNSKWTHANFTWVELYKLATYFISILNQCISISLSLRLLP